MQLELVPHEEQYVGPKIENGLFLQQLYHRKTPEKHGNFSLNVHVV